MPEVPEEEEEAAAAAAMEAKAAALPAAGEQLEVEVAEAGGAVAWKCAEVRSVKRGQRRFVVCVNSEEVCPPPWEARLIPS